MTSKLCMFSLGVLLLLAGCRTVEPTPDTPWGEPYADVAVPENYGPYNTPPFRRDDGADGRRIFGRYAYRSAAGLDKPSRVADWFKTELPKQGWASQLDELDDEKGTMTLRWQKGDDKLVLRLAPDTLFNNSDRFSVLTVEMNPPYGN